MNNVSFPISSFFNIQNHYLCFGNINLRRLQFGYYCLTVILVLRYTVGQLIQKTLIFVSFADTELGQLK